MRCASADADAQPTKILGRTLSDTAADGARNTTASADMATDAVSKTIKTGATPFFYDYVYYGVSKAVSQIYPM